MLKNIWILFLLIFLSFVGFFSILSSGININQFSFAGVNISKLYIKLDKKLIVNIEEIDIPIISNPETVSRDSNLYIKQIPLLLNIFESVNIKTFKIKDNIFSLTIDKSNFYIDNNQINLSARPIIEDDKVLLEIFSLMVKKQQILFDGVLSANLENDEISFDGRGFYKDIEFNLITKTDKDTIDFSFSTANHFSSINYVKDFVRLDPIIEEWMYDNVEGDISLKYLKGKLDKKSLLPIISSLNGLATVKNAKIKFHKDLDVVKTPLLKVSFKDDNLYFDLEKPKYKDIDITGSKVTIYSLTKKDEPSNIVIDIATKHRLDNNVLQLLKAYEVTLPIKQLDGGTNSKLSIQIFFTDFEVKTKGLFTTQNSNFSLNGFEFLAENATVELNDYIVDIKQSDVLVDNLVEGVLNLSIDTAKEDAIGDVNIKKLKVDAHGLELLKIDDFLTTINVDYKTTPTINFKELFTKISIYNEFTNILVEDLNFAKNYSDFLKDIKVGNGDLSVNIYDKDKIDFFANFKELDLPIYSKNGKQIKKLVLNGSTTQNGVNITSKDKKIQVDINNIENTIKIDNIDIKISENNDNSKEAKSQNLDIKGIKSDILIDDTTKIKADKYTISLKDKNTNIELFYKNGTFNYKKDKYGKTNLKAKNLNNEFMNNLIGVKDLFLGGEFNLNAIGSQNSISGNLHINKSKIEKLAVINNLITFLNTTPAIVNPLFAIPAAVGMVTNGGFDVTGYEINEGSLDFNYDLKNNIFYIKQLDTNGNMANFHATGLINIGKKQINSVVSVVFLKSYSDIVNYIPVVNYLVLGDDDKISTEVKITGDLFDPKIETNLAKDAATGTFDFVKRIFLLPKKGIEMLTPEK